MGVDLKALYQQKRVLEATWRKSAREGTLEAMVGPLRPRDKAEMTDLDFINGDSVEMEGIWIVSVTNPRADIVGGRVMMAKPNLAAQMIVFDGNFRVATSEEIAGEKLRQDDALNERIAGARLLSLKSDAKYGKRD